MKDAENIRIAPIYKSLIRPQLMFGCDRILVFLLLMATALLGGPGGIGAGNVVNLAIGVVVFLIGIRLLAALAKFDPDAREVFRRSLRFTSFYPASSGFRVRDKAYTYKP